jgi:hypothetical protein
MSDHFYPNPAINVAATTNIKHTNLPDLHLSTVRKLYRGGIRPGEPIRTRIEAQQMLEKIPPSQRVRPSDAQQYLTDKHASHITPHSQGGSNQPNNIKFENAKDNLARGGEKMTLQEQMRLDAKWQFDNLTGAIKAGIQAVPKGAAVGALTILPFSLLSNALRVIRGEISAQQAATATLKDTAIGGVVGGGTAFAITTVAAACPPIAIALTTVAPVLAVVGAGGMVYEFFKILGDHKQAVRTYYESLTQQELERLQAIETELIYEHQKNLEFLAQAKAVNQEIINRPIAPGVEGAMQRLRESAAIAQSLGLTSTNSKLLPESQLPSLPPSS